jgi:hypothetical protein
VEGWDNRGVGLMGAYGLTSCSAGSKIPAPESLHPGTHHVPPLLLLLPIIVALPHRYDRDENGCLNFSEFMSLMKAHMLDVSEVLAYVGARPQSPTTTRTVVQVSTIPTGTASLQSGLCGHLCCSGRNRAPLSTCGCHLSSTQGCANPPAILALLSP